MNDLNHIKMEARRHLAEAIVQYGFLRANWGKLSTIVIVVATISFWLGATIF